MFGAAPPLVIGIGEIIWDHFASGARLGGCPTNVVCHAHALGVRTALVSAVGDDARGAEFFAQWNARALDASYVVKDSHHATGVIDIALDARGEPTFALRTPPASDYLSWTPELAQLAARADAVTFGTFGQWNALARATIENFLAQTAPTCVRVLDVNLRESRYSPALIESSLHRATILKCNDDEFAVMKKIFNLTGSCEAQLTQLCERFNLALIALTRADRGAVLLRAHGECDDHPGHAVSVVDTVGAGDAFTAALTVGVLRKLPLAKLNAFANDVASRACTYAGATPPMTF